MLLESRLSGGEGSVTLHLARGGTAADGEQQQQQQQQQQQVVAWVDLDTVSHKVLPWPVPTPDDIDALVSGVGDEEGADAAVEEGARAILPPGVGRYVANQELAILSDNVWLDALVLSPPADRSSTLHRVLIGGNRKIALYLHPVSAVAVAPRLTRLNVQFNAIKGDHKVALEKANATRKAPLSLAL